MIIRHSLIIALFPVFLIYSTVYSQDALKYLKIKGRIVENNANALVDAKAILYKNSVKIDEKYTSKDGKFFFTLELNQQYLVEVTMPYYITKKISFSTTVPPDIKVIYPYKFTINIFKHIEGIDYSVLKKPIGHVKYYSEVNKFDYDEDYTNSIMAKLEKLYEQIAQKEAAPPARPPPLQVETVLADKDPISSLRTEEEEKESESKEIDYARTLEKEPSLRPSSVDIIYKIQIVTSAKPIPLIAKNFNGLEGVNEYFDNGLYKYTVGETTNYKYANTILKKRIRSLGFKNAFVVSFKDNKRIYEKYKDENISTKLKDAPTQAPEISMEEKKELVKIKSENAKQKQKTKAFLNRKNVELEVKTLKKQMEKEIEMDKIQEVKDKLAIAKSRKIFLEEIADSKRTIKKREALQRANNEL